MNAGLDESLKVPLLESHRAASLEHVDEASKKLSSETKPAQALELARSAVPQPAEYVSTPILDGIMSEWLYYHESMEDVFKLLEMKKDGYDNFDMMKYVVLEEYRARIMKTDPKEEPKGLDHFLLEICDGVREIYAMLIQDLMAVRQDPWLKDIQNELFTLFEDAYPPNHIEFYLKRMFRNRKKDVESVLKAYEEFRNPPKGQALQPIRQP